MYNNAITVNIAILLKTNFYKEHLWWLLLNSNLILATQILTKIKGSYFYIFVLATQTKQVKNVHTLLISTKNVVLSAYNRATYLDQTQAIM